MTAIPFLAVGLIAAALTIWGFLEHDLPPFMLIAGLGISLFWIFVVTPAAAESD